MMEMTNRDKIALNHYLVSKLKCLLVDKPDGSLPSRGKYYYPNKPHELSTVGSLAPQPTIDDLQGQFAPAPNSMGLVFLVVPDENNSVRVVVDGHFDLAHAYVPEIEEVIENLIVVNDVPREEQDVPESFIRYGLTFENHVFEFNVGDRSSSVIESKEDKVATAIDDHISAISSDVSRRSPGSHRTTALGESRRSLNSLLILRHFLVLKLFITLLHSPVVANLKTCIPSLCNNLALFFGAVIRKLNNFSHDFVLPCQKHKEQALIVVYPFSCRDGHIPLSGLTTLPR